MGRLVFTVCLIFVIALNSAEFSAKVIDSNIDAIVEDLATTLSESKELKELLIQEQLSDGPKLQITYRLGSRTNGKSF